MEWIFDYSVMIATGDSDSGEWTTELSDEETELLLDAILDGDDPADFFAESGITDRVYAEVLADVGSDLLESVDLYDEGEEDPTYILDEGCEVDIIPQDPDTADDKLIELLIRRAVQRSKYEGTGIIHDVLESYGKLYSEDADEYALGCAVNLKAHAYLLECRKADEPGIQDESPVIPSEEVYASCCADYLGCKFAVRGDNWKIIAFTKSFQNEVFQTLLDENDLEREDVIAFLDGSGEEPQYRGDLKRTLRSIGVYPFNGDAAFENMVGEDGAEAAELIDWLGIPTLTARTGECEIYYIS